VSFDNVWFESLGGCFELLSNGGVSVTNSRFANAADGLRLPTAVAGTGYIVKHGTLTSFEFGANNVISGTFDNFTNTATNINNINRNKILPFNTLTDGKFTVTSHSTTTISSIGAIDIKGNNFVFARANQTDATIRLSDITSHLPPGEILTIRAWEGPITITNTGSIRLGTGMTNLTIADLGYVTLMRVNELSGLKWIYISHTETQLDAVPATGYWARGTKIWKINPSHSSSPGWINVSAGVPGTWATMPALGASV
jgi:hypothetical protein